MNGPCENCGNDLPQHAPWLRGTDNVVLLVCHRCAHRLRAKGWVTAS